MSDNDNKQNNEQKSYPYVTPEVAKMFGMTSEFGVGSHASAEQAKPVSPADLPVANLPVGEMPKFNSEPAPVSAEQEHMASGHTVTDRDLKRAAIEDEIERDLQNAKQSGKFFSFAKTAAPYVVVFVLATFLYVFFFKNVDFTSLFKSTAKVSTPKETVLAQLEKQGLTGYYAWIGSFYYDVSTSTVTDPEVDNSGNGLTNFQKYLLNLNPKSYDTLGLGRSDTESLAMGVNPLTGNPLTQNQKDVVDKYVDLEVAMNRLALNHLQNPALPEPSAGFVAGAEVQNSDIRGNNYGFGQPQTVTPTPIPTVSQRDEQVTFPATQTAYAASSFVDSLDVDTSVPGKLEIPSLKVSAPIMWTEDTKNFDRDLQSGVVHYPGTALPGQLGTAYISGHSSNYAWAKGSYNHVFTHLGDLADNTSFQITVTLHGGKTAILHYVVAGRHEYSPTDPAQYRNEARSVVALSTCWPVGSTAKRLVVFGVLTQTEK